MPETLLEPTAMCSMSHFHSASAATMHRSSHDQPTTERDGKRLWQSKNLIENPKDSHISLRNHLHATQIPRHHLPGHVPISFLFRRD
jgi:hypothetical protein